MDRNCRRIAVNRNANRAAAGITGDGGMGVTRFQPVKDEDQQNAAQRNPTPEPAHFELSTMYDTHNLVACTKPEYSTRSIQHQPRLCCGWLTSFLGDP